MDNEPARERRALWIYPWDIADAGIAPTVRRARDDWKLTALSLAASYHSSKDLLPTHGSQQLYLSPGAAVYFRPDDRAYGDTPLRPLVTPRDDLLDVLDRTAAACHDAGLSLRAWTVGLHNSRLGEAHPEATEENVFGNRYPWGLCPSKPAVRAYLVGLIRDLATNHDLDAIDLESVGFHGFTHGHHHERVGINFAPLDEMLLGLCFCDACRERAQARGVDADRLRRDVRSLLDARFAVEAQMPPPDADDLRPVLSLLLSWPELRGYIETRCDTVTSLVDEIRREALAGTRTELALTAATFMRAVNAWQEGMDLRALARVANGIIFLSYFHDPQAVAADVQFAREQTGDATKIVVGLSLTAPLTTSAANLRAKVDAARALGIGKFSFYNYGFVSAARLDWLAALAAD